MLYKDFIKEIDKYIEECDLDKETIDINIVTSDKWKEEETWTDEIEKLERSTWPARFRNRNSKLKDEIWVYMR